HGCDALPWHSTRVLRQISRASEKKSRNPPAPEKKTDANWDCRTANTNSLRRQTPGRLLYLLPKDVLPSEQACRAHRFPLPNSTCQQIAPLIGIHHSCDRECRGSRFGWPAQAAFAAGPCKADQSEQGFPSRHSQTDRAA